MLKYFKKACRYTLRKIICCLQHVLGQKVFYCNIWDLLIPIDGQMSATQYFIASRLLDLDLIMSGKEPIWQNRLHDLLDTPFSEEQGKVANQRFKVCVSSLTKRGNMTYSHPFSISENPLSLNNGTHRVAYLAINEPNSWLACELIRKDKKMWFPLDGSGFWGLKGLTTSELQQLEVRYSNLLASGGYLTGYIYHEYWESFLEKASKYGEISEYEHIALDERHAIIFHLKLFRQVLYIKNDEIKSRYVETLQKSMNEVFSDWGRIEHTVGDSQNLEVEIETRINRNIFI